MAGAAAPIRPPPYVDPWKQALESPAALQAALYNVDPYRPRPSAGSPTLGAPAGGATGTLSAEGYIVTDWNR
jgi:hypothetical protein